ncbi:cofactor assembly of complex C subunit B [Calothrix sp. FACHB-1219]|uniref:cofactor assembly of complex C subunit B n=1 Tax=unclassified Calothrix TaxID=2619626 RepID=UPI00168329A2|nr:MULTISPECIES: cofactor assembly of complex C subunit B [unclassified Calothrix]MBD2202399.1 cofactor assembly of complex C subunit B [Calothrix sp. FACHB-168]MBD2222375.1 cofactor assembly of complex C subunit B [Calothrix sp. FACHB-1219]
MDTAILPSTFLLTLLLSVGLFFFIRASTKERTQTAQLISEQDEATLMPQLKEYFRSRSYRVAAVDREQNQVTFEGFVKPSWFLAVFLTLLAFAGLVCLSLVLSILFPSVHSLFFGLLLLSPMSGIFYWKKAGRLEKVSLKLESNPNQQQSSSKITVIAHRDELTELQKALQLKAI